MSLLELERVRAGYGPLSVLQGVDLGVAAGEVVAILGPNGAGKSTLMRAIAGLIPVQHGQVRLDGRDLTRVSAARRVQLGLALVPEGRLLFSTLSVLDHLRLGADPGRPSRAELRRRLDEMFELFPVLAERQGELAGCLSGGQQQMVAMARGLMSRPRVLLLDEPSLGLGPRVRADIYAVLTRLRAQGGLTVVLVEQDAALALALAGRALVMQGGRVVREGTRDDFRRDASLRQVYLGQAMPEREARR